MLQGLNFRDFLFSIRIAYKLYILRVSKVLAWDEFHEFCWNEPYLKIPSWQEYKIEPHQKSCCFGIFYSSKTK